MALLPDLQLGAVGDDPTQKIESLVKQLNEWGRLLSNEDRTKLTKDDAGVQRILHGFQLDGFANGSVGMKMSQTDVDVLNATDEELIFSTDFRLLKIVDIDTATQPVPSLTSDETTTMTVPHNLGYVPAIIVYVNGTGSTYLTSGRYYPAPKAVTIRIGTEYSTGIEYTYEVDDTNIYFNVTNWSSATPVTDIGTANWKYYLFRETAN